MRLFLLGLIVATLRYPRADFQRCEMLWEPIIKSSRRWKAIPNLLNSERGN